MTEHPEIAEHKEIESAMDAALNLMSSGTLDKDQALWIYQQFKTYQNGCAVNLEALRTFTTERFGVDPETLPDPMAKE